MAYVVSSSDTAVIQLVMPISPVSTDTPFFLPQSTPLKVRDVQLPATTADANPKRPATGQVYPRGEGTYRSQ